MSFSRAVGFLTTTSKDSPRLDPVAAPTASGIRGAVTIDPDAVPTSTLLFDPTARPEDGPTQAPPLLTPTTSSLIQKSSNTISILSSTPLPSPSQISGKNNDIHPGIIALVCVAGLSVLLLLIGIYFKVTRKRWPFTAGKGRKIILKPHHAEGIKRSTTENLDGLERAGGQGIPSNPGGVNVHPLSLHHPQPSPGTPILGEPLLQCQVMALMSEVENIRARLMVVGAQAGPPAQLDDPPDYFSQASSAEIRPPVTTREKPRNAWR